MNGTRRPLWAACATASRVELERPAGTWHEVVRYPNRFPRGGAAEAAAP